MENDYVISDSVRHQLGANNVSYVMNGYWSMTYTQILQLSIDVIEMAMYDVLYKLDQMYLFASGYNVCTCMVSVFRMETVRMCYQWYRLRVARLSIQVKSYALPMTVIDLPIHTFELRVEKGLVSNALVG